MAAWKLSTQYHQQIRQVSDSQFSKYGINWQAFLGTASGTGNVAVTAEIEGRRMR